MPRSENGVKPQKSTEQVATELRQRLESRLGSERTEAIWQDPTHVQDVVEGEEEAASVAGMILEAWKDLPAEQEEAPVERKRGKGFRRGLRLALIAAVAVWAVSVLNKSRRSSEV
jgi:hypothetical protein